MKDCLTSASVLTLPEGSGGFAISCDALYVGLVCVLIQYEKVIAYAQKQLKVHKRNYLTHNPELAAIIFALKIWEHYLYGVHVDIFIDYKSLQDMFIQRDLNLRQSRLLEILNDYDISVIFHPAKGKYIWLMHLVEYLWAALHIVRMEKIVGQRSASFGSFGCEVEWFKQWWCIFTTWGGIVFSSGS